MKGSKAVVGVYEFVDDCIKAIKEAKKAGHEYIVYSPVPNPEIEAHTSPPKSPVRFVTATGALSGITGGFALAIWTSLDWPLRTSAKEIVSVPGFVVIGYEMTILLGALFTLAALFIFCKFPNPFRQVGYEPRFSRDKFGVVVGCEPNQTEEIKSFLESAGAQEVYVTDGL